MKRFLMLLIALVPVLSSAQENKFLTDPHYGNTDKVFLETQEWQTYDMVKKILDKYPPCPSNECPERKMALLAMDAYLHNTSFDWSPAQKQFMRERMDTVLHYLNEVPVSKNVLRVYKIYDMGFILQSSSMVVGIDVSSQGGHVFDRDQALALADRMDAMFITHYHGDHADALIINRMAKDGKTVIVPTTYAPEQTDIQHMRDEEKVISGKLRIHGKQLHYKLFPGHQNETPTTNTMNNHIGLVFPEGFVTVHLGDQAHSEDNVWMKKAGKELRGLDLLFSTAWMGDLDIIIPGYGPKMVFTGHDNEMGHSIPSRIPFWYAYHNYGKIPYPTVIMNWGEIYEYSK